jgi:hypothetical protein
MKNTKLVQLVAMIVASSTLGAKGLACLGSCHDYADHRVIPLLRAHSGEQGGTTPTETTDTLCALHCSGMDSCKSTSIAQPDGTSIPALECASYHTCGAGRRPAGVEFIESKNSSAIAQWLVQSAHLEAVSVDAFRLLRRDLRAHRAPRSLLRQASRAAREEKRHARRMKALAKRAGIECLRPVVNATRPPTLEELALQNATEGCVRETLGAVLVQYQARHAKDRQIAAAMKSIAPDEANHAALAHRVHSWIMRRLSVAARDRVELARRRCADEFVRNAVFLFDPSANTTLGLPDVCTAHALTAAFIEHFRLA